MRGVLTMFNNSKELQEELVRQQITEEQYERLTERQKMIFKLKYLDKHTIPKIADEISYSVSTVKKDLQKIRRMV